MKVTYQKNGPTGENGAIEYSNMNPMALSSIPATEALVILTLKCPVIEIQ